MAIRTYTGFKVTPSGGQFTEDALTVEQPLTIVVNGKVFTITMQTPGEEEALVRGLLFHEDIYRKPASLPLTFEKQKSEYITHALVEIAEQDLGDGYKNSRNLLSVSSCGICGKTSLEHLDSRQQLTTANFECSVQDLSQMYQAMESAQMQFASSGGSHAAAIFDRSQHLISISEDIGRHNAVDKAIGNLLMKNTLSQAQYLLVSGRISYEILSKTFAARIPIISAVSAPSSLAVDFAKELGITLIGFARTGKFTAYSHIDRIV